MMTIFIVTLVITGILLLLSIILNLMFDIISSLSMVSYMLFTGLFRFVLIAVIVFGTIVIAKNFYNKHFKKSEA